MSSAARIHRAFSGRRALPITVLLLMWATAAPCAEPIRVLSAVGNPEPLRDAIAAFVAREKTLVEVTVTDKVAAPTVYAQKGPFDAVIAPCNRTAEKWLGGALVLADSGCSLYWKRMAAVIPPGNPRGICGPGDLGRADLRVAVQTLCVGRVDQTLATLKPRVVMQAEGSALLIKLLREGDVDVILTFDAAVADHADSLVIMRLPRSVVGDLGATPVPMYVTANSPHPEAARKLIDFLNKSPYARDVFLSHALMLDDGVADARSYDTGAAQRFAKVYRNICQQVVDDYKITKGAALDIGCGPGQLALELARMTDLKVTGLDIEPEVIELATRHAQEAGLAHRTQFVAADAHQLPFADNSFDLVLSRGTWTFLRDHVQAFREAYRVMKPGGVAFIGGGRGRYTTAEEWAAIHPGGRNPEEAWFKSAQSKRESTFFPFPLDSYDVLMARVGVPPGQYTATDEGGHWVEIRK